VTTPDKGHYQGCFPSDSRLLALAVGDHLPVELAIRAADITAQLQRMP
jgi:hypothetical protein